MADIAKGYWIGSVEVHDPERYKDYVKTATPAYERFGARFLARGGKVVASEGNPGSRNVVIEFPSLQAAIDCYNAPEYAEARAIRQSISSGNLVIVEGFSG